MLYCEFWEKTMSLVVKKLSIFVKTVTNTILQATSNVVLWILGKNSMYH